MAFCMIVRVWKAMAGRAFMRLLDVWALMAVLRLQRALACSKSGYDQDLFCTPPHS